jgi:hypothetical protein
VLDSVALLEPLSPDLHADAEARRALRFAERRKLNRVSQVRKLRTCGRGVRDETVDVVVTTDEAGNRRGAAQGLVTCSSVWACPVCAEHIRTARGLDIAEAFRRWTAGVRLPGPFLPGEEPPRLGGGLAFVTLTLRHDREDALADLLDGLMKSWGKLQATTGWRNRAKSLGLRGMVRSIEVTYGEANGWHPHLHLYLFLEEELTPAKRDELLEFLTTAWLRESGKFGYEGLRGIAVDVRRVDPSATALEVLAAYAAKPEQLHLEATRGHRKGDPDRDRWAPMDLIDAAADGEVWALRRWHEFEKSTHGRRAIEWSRGLRALLGMDRELDDQELTDDSCADDAEELELVATLSGREWTEVCAAGLDYEVLRAAVVGGAAGVAAVLAQAKRTPRQWWRCAPDRPPDG